MPTQRKVPPSHGGAGQTASASTGAGAKATTDAQKHARPASGSEAAAVLTPKELVYLSEEHTNQLRLAFDMFDSAGTGRIRVSEVKVAFYALGYPANGIELERVLKEAGVSTGLGPNGEEPTMDFNGFQSVLLCKMMDKESRIESVRAFKQIDEDDKGHISLDDLRDIADSLHMDLTHDELVEMVLFAQSATASKAGSGVSAMVGEFGAKESLAVSEEQFLKLLKRANVY